MLSEMLIFYISDFGLVGADVGLFIFLVTAVLSAGAIIVGS